jgi:hypothetical protein
MAFVVIFGGSQRPRKSGEFFSCRTVHPNYHPGTPPRFRPSERHAILRWRHQTQQSRRRIMNASTVIASISFSNPKTPSMIVDGR